MTDTLFRIILAAVKIRIARGEDLDIILASYSKLTDTDKDRIRNEI